MFIPHQDSVFHVDPGTTPDYNHGSTLVGVMRLIEKASLAADREHYRMDDVNYLFPFRSLQLYGPSGSDNNVLDQTQQDNKTDFQKQNVRQLVLSDIQLVRGWAVTDDGTWPFLQFSYNGGPGSVLAGATGNKLSKNLELSLKVNGQAVGGTIAMPYDDASGRYLVEIWGYTGADLRSRLGSRGAAAFDSGRLIIRPDIAQGAYSDFTRDGLDGIYIAQRAVRNVMHPILPLTLEVAVSNDSGTIWDSQNGANYVFQFNMIVRGWNNFLGVGISPNPHGGIGYLEYRNLMSNYGRYSDRPELGRSVEAWEFNAFNQKTPGGSQEPFFAVNYMDLHLLDANCGIGLHRHRDNQEIFLMMAGHAYMVVGDWCQMPGRERALEVRTLTAGHFAMLKGGQLHGLMNPTDASISLFMFGGYD